MTARERLVGGIAVHLQDAGESVGRASGRIDTIKDIHALATGSSQILIRQQPGCLTGFGRPASSRAQLVLELQNHDHQALAERSAEGLIEALADLLLEALRAEEPTMKGGEDEHQDHL